MEQEKFKCAVIGVSGNPTRYAYLATQRLIQHGYPVTAYGLRPVHVLGTDVIADKHVVADIDTVTLYVGPAHQEIWLPLILDLAPRRVIFNPGTENPEIQEQLENAGIEVLEACTLVMLSTGSF